MARMKVKLFLDLTALAIYLVDDCFTEHKIVPQYYIIIVGFMANESFVGNIHRKHNKHLADYLQLRKNKIYYVEVPSIQKTNL